MNFFEQQEVARRNTRLLVVLFLLAVACLVLVTLVFLTLFPWQTHAGSFAPGGSNHPLACLLEKHCDFWHAVWQMGDKLLAAGTGMVMVIGGVSLYKWFTLRQGGRVVADLMGATEVMPDTTNPLEKRLLNVVEEMAIAANMPVPAVYVMYGEPGINAFAAGFSTRDAVVAVTEGALQQFSREQLQGVVAHEFSHILNGDMRLNMQMIAVLHGIMFITELGYVFLRSGRYGSSRKNNGLQVALGLGLVVIGSVGTLFGNIIKAAVGRQREFLADASAVQFTRNPDGIGGALKVIGASSSLVHNGHGGEISHLFISEALTRMQGLFATHPPLKQRIRRIDPGWNGIFPKLRQPEPAADRQAREEHALINFEPVLAVAAAAVAASHEALRAENMNILHHPVGAAAAITCLLLAGDDKVRARQLERIASSWPELHMAIGASPFRNAQREDFLPVVELSTSALRQLPVADYQRFKQLLLALMKVDGVIDIYEWSLYYLMKSALDPHFGKVLVPRPRYRSTTEIGPELKVVIAMLVQSSTQNEACRQRALERAYEVCGLTPVPDSGLPAAGMHEFNAAMRKLANAYPLLKARIIKALVDAARSDGEVEMVERHVIMAIGAAMDTPVINLDLPAVA